MRGSGKYKGDKLRAQLSLANFGEAAANRVVVGAFFAKRRGGACNTKAGAAISLETTSQVARAGVLGPNPGASVPANVSVKGNKVALSVRGPQFARKRFNCVVISSLISVSATQVKVTDRVSFRLKG